MSKELDKISENLETSNHKEALKFLTFEEKDVTLRNIKRYTTEYLNDIQDKDKNPIEVKASEIEPTKTNPGLLQKETFNQFCFKLKREGLSSKKLKEEIFKNIFKDNDEYKEYTNDVIVELEESYSDFKYLKINNIKDIDNSQEYGYMFYNVQDGFPIDTPMYKDYLNIKFISSPDEDSDVQLHYLNNDYQPLIEEEVSETEESESEKDEKDGE